MNNRIVLFQAFTLFGLVLMLPHAVVAEDERCLEDVQFTLGTDGGEFIYEHAMLFVLPGVLTRETTFTMSICPGFADSQDHEHKLVYRGEDDPEIRAEIAIRPSGYYPSVKIEAPDGLRLADGAHLTYCLLGDDEESTSDYIVFHEDKAAPADDFLGTDETQNCVQLHSLSFIHHLKHKAKHAYHKAKHKAKHAYHKAKHKAKHTAGGAWKAAKSAGKSMKKAGKAVEKGAKEMPEASKEAWEALKRLATPCRTCKFLVKKGINYFACERPIAQSTAKCTEALDEEEPEMAEHTPAMCTGIAGTVKAVCKTSPNLGITKKIEDRVAKEVCRVCHLCKH